MLSKIKHDINNPVSVIAGNAQFLRELAKAENLGPVFAESIDDIEAACGMISTILERLEAIEDGLEEDSSSSA